MGDLRVEMASAAFAYAAAAAAVAVVVVVVVAAEDETVLEVLLFQRAAQLEVDNVQDT